MPMVREHSLHRLEEMCVLQSDALTSVQSIQVTQCREYEHTMSINQKRCSQSNLMLSLAYNRSE
jgi:hypothetical protein